MSVLKTADGRLIVVSGASRCGKTTQVSKMVNKERRLCAWDPEDQWAQLPGWRKVTTRQELLAAMQTAGRVRVAYVAGGDTKRLKEEFEYWCDVVFHAARFIAPLTCIAEELADVTTASKAPGSWGIIVRRGMKRGLTTYAISQRWAEADKSCMGNASEYLVFACRPKDLPYVARSTGLPEVEINALKPFEFIQWDPVTKEKRTAKIRF